MRNRARTYWLVGATGSAAHLIVAAVLSRSVGASYEDGGHFHVLAAGLASDLEFGPPHFDAARPPGWPMLLAIPYRIFGPHPNVGLVLTAILAGLTAVALMRLGMTPGQATLAGLVVELRERRQVTFRLPALVLFALSRRLDWRAATGAVANDDLSDSGQANEGLPVPPVDEVENDRLLCDFGVAWIAALVPVAVGLWRRHRGPWLVPLRLVLLLTLQVMAFGAGWWKGAVWPRSIASSTNLEKESVS